MALIPKHARVDAVTPEDTLDTSVLDYVYDRENVSELEVGRGVVSNEYEIEPEGWNEEDQEWLDSFWDNLSRKLVPQMV